MNSEAVAWLEQNWTPERLPNNSWIVVGSRGFLFSLGERGRPIIRLESLFHLDLNEVVFVYVTFDTWQ